MHRVAQQPGDLGVDPVDAVDGRDDRLTNSDTGSFPDGAGTAAASTEPGRGGQLVEEGLPLEACPLQPFRVGPRVRLGYLGVDLGQPASVRRESLGVENLAGVRIPDADAGVTRDRVGQDERAERPGRAARPDGADSAAL